MRPRTLTVAERSDPVQREAKITPFGFAYPFVLCGAAIGAGDASVVRVLFPKPPVGAPPRALGAKVNNGRRTCGRHGSRKPAAAVRACVRACCVTGGG